MSLSKVGIPTPEAPASAPPADSERQTTANAIRTRDDGNKGWNGKRSGMPGLTGKEYPVPPASRNRFVRLRRIPMSLVPVVALRQPRPR
jgi:hypothetical protein